MVFYKREFLIFADLARSTWKLGQMLLPQRGFFIESSFIFDKIVLEELGIIDEPAYILSKTNLDFF